MERNISDKDMQSMVSEQYRNLIERLLPRGNDRRVSINSVINPSLDRRQSRIDRRQ